MNWVYFAPNCCEELTGSISCASGNENPKQFYPAVLWSIHRLLKELAKYQLLWKPPVFCFLCVFSTGLARKQSGYWHAHVYFTKCIKNWDRRSQCIQKVSLIAQITMVSSSNKVMWNSCNEESSSQWTDSEISLVLQYSSEVGQAPPECVEPMSHFIACEFKISFE